MATFRARAGNNLEAVEQLPSLSESGKTLEAHLSAMTLTSISVYNLQDPEVHISTEELQSTLGKRRPRKGKRVPADHVRGLLHEVTPRHVCVEGPRGIGKTTLL